MLGFKQYFEPTYIKEEHLRISFCPYRICPLGAHVDHQQGKITGLAIDKGVTVAYAPNDNGIVELVSNNFEGRISFHVNNLPKEKKGDWADYLRGATASLARTHKLEYGMRAVVEGSLPIGGLSSSSSVTIAYLSALCDVNGIHLTHREMIETALWAEVAYIGVKVGKLDQSCEVLSKKDHLLYLDTRTDEFELIKQNPAMKPYEIAIIFSGVERSLIKSPYNTRVDECKAAAYALKAYAGISYNRYKESYLRDIPFDVFERYKDRLPESWRMRAEHFFTENQRVEQGVEAWQNGDIEEFGRLSFESGESSIKNYHTGSPELIALHNIMRGTDGIYGGRFSGAGFKGCCMALIDPEYEDSIKEHITSEYLKQFSGLKDSFSIYFCKSSDGIKF